MKHGASESQSWGRLDHVARCIEIIRQGGMIIMTDDEDRENEGDLVIAAEHCNAEANEDARRVAGQSVFGGPVLTNAYRYGVRVSA